MKQFIILITVVAYTAALPQLSELHSNTGKDAKSQTDEELIQKLETVLASSQKMKDKLSQDKAISSHEQSVNKDRSLETFFELLKKMILKSQNPQMQQPQAAKADTGCLLSMEQVQDIQSTTNSRNFYIVADGEVFNTSDVTSLPTHLEKISQIADEQGKTISDIWLSRIPDFISRFILNARFSNKPTLHIESQRILLTEDNTLAGFMETAGCISQLKADNFNVNVWDWDMFAKKTKTPKCDHYTLNHSYYFAQQRQYSKLMRLISGLETLCTN